MHFVILLEQITDYAEDIEPVTFTEKIRPKSSATCQSEKFVFAIITDPVIYKYSKTTLINFNQKQRYFGLD